MTRVSSHAMGAFAFNSHVTNVTLKTMKIVVDTNVSIFLLTGFLFDTNAYGFIQTGILIC